VSEVYIHKLKMKRKCQRKHDGIVMLHIPLLTYFYIIGSTGDMSAHTINQLATWMIEHPCIDSEVLEGREDDSGHASGSEILLSRAQVTNSSVFTILFYSKVP
jgi:hypothetical protein